MAFEKLLSVSGKSGLFRLVGQMKNGIIVESIEDGKRFPVHGSAKVSALDEISIYTESEEVPLREVFKRMMEKTSGKEVLSHKEDAEKIKAFFESILPEYDRERVYASDMAKVVRWFNILIKHDAMDLSEPEAEKEKEEEAKEIAKSESGDKKEAKPKKAAPKKSATASKKTAAPKKPAASTKVTAPRKSGGTQRGS